MRRTILIYIVTLAAGPLWAADPPQAPASVTPPLTTTSTEHTFEDVLVQGKFDFADESVTTVEEDKVLDALIGVRTEFKDRMQQSAERY